MTHSDHSASERVLEKIEQGSIRMHSRLYFTLRLLATMLAALAVLLLSAFVISFVLYSLDEGGELFLLGFGTRGALMFLALFPWKFLAVDIVAVLLLRYLLRGFRSVYRFSFTTTLIAIVGTSIALALLINLTPLHALLRERADADDLPFLGALYTGIDAPHEEEGEFRGTIRSIDGRTLVITHDDQDIDDDDGSRTVYVPDSIDISTFKVGDEVYIAGEQGEESIEAYGAREFPSRH